MKNLILILFLMSSLSARTNPFEETINITDTALPEIGITPEEEKHEFLGKTAIDLPNGSKEVKAVIIEYVDKNGITNRKTVKINKQLRGNNPIMIAQSSQVSLPVVDEQNSQRGGVFANPNKKLNSVQAVNNNQTSSNINTNGFINIVGQDYTSVEEYKPFPFLKIRVSENEIVFDTSKQVLRDFIISNPTKIVVDFSRVPSFNTKTIRLKNQSIAKNLSFGAHRDFFRVAIELSGKQRYKVYKLAAGGCKIVFR
jgi:hypothetical protein